MQLTRRDIGKMALASVPFAGALRAAQIDSKFYGVQIGAITYSFNRIASPDPEAIIRAYVEIGLGEAELMSNHCEALAGAPSIARPGGGGGGGRGGGGGAAAVDIFPNVDTFVKNGGSVLAFNTASSAFIDALKLPVKNVLAGVRPNDFYAPGSIFGVEIKRDSPIARGFTATVPAIWFENGPAFEITDPTQATAVATYQATGNPLLSGWLLGGAKLNGKAALVDAKHGKGHVVLYGFRPQYRGQSVSTYPLIWGAIAQ
jgi:hypothetical protein